MRVLSKAGKIEHLNITGGTYENDEDDNEPPLIFKNLQTFQCNWYKHSVNHLLKALTESKMPEIHSFHFSKVSENPPHSYYVQHASIGLLKLIRSKKTLRLLIYR